MTECLSHIQQYIPCRKLEKTWDIEPFTQTDYQFLTTLVGGDQLSTARARGAIDIQGNAENSYDKLHGVLPVTEDWHAKVCLMQVRLSHFVDVYTFSIPYDR